MARTVKRTRPAPPPPSPPVRISIVQGTLEADQDAIVLVTPGGLRLTLDVGARNDAAAARALLSHRLGADAAICGRQDGGTLHDARLVQRPSEIDDTAAFAAVRAALALHTAELLARPGVLAVRPGYRFDQGWTDGIPAIVVVTDPASTPDLPAQLDGVPLDRQPASPLQQLAARGPRAGNEQLSNPAGYALPAFQAATPGVATLEPELVRRSKYVPPPGLLLDPVSGPVDVLCHCSPDAGWPTLQTFLAGTQSTLTVAMYDFTAPHILTQLSTTLARAGTLQLVLDPRISLSAGGDGENPKADDKTEDEVVGALRQRLRTRFAFDWAAVTQHDKTTGGIFPTAYHIKVAVRDGNAMWLSSGNWQSSNQPPFDPLNADAGGVEGVYNREWHVVIDDARLAGLYERFIQYDATQAAPLQVQPETHARPDVLIPETLTAQSAGSPRFFAPSRITLAADEQVQPLLTPDNYAAHLLPLLAGATKSIWFQNQYIHFSNREDQNPPEFLALAGALRDQIQAGLDVRILLRAIGDTREMIEALVHFGIPPKCMKLQKAAHNKGIIIDDEILVLGSHNWSGDGTVYNRDASLIFRSKSIAAYYKPIFDYDWTNDRTTAQRIETDDLSPQLATGAPTPPGMLRVPWGVYYGDSQPGWIDDAIERLAIAPPSAGFDLQRATSMAVGTAPSLPRSSPVADLLAARDELTQRYLTSERAQAITLQARFASPEPEANIMAVGVGEKISDGLHTGTLAVHLFVRVKYARGALSTRNMLPSHIAGVPIDITEMGEMTKLTDFPDPRAQLTPAQPGASVGFAFPGDTERMAGTFGALLQDPDTGQFYILSNNHVLANEGRFAAGTPIYQSGLLDLSPGLAKRQIATLQTVAPLTANPLRVDAAVALVDRASDVTPEILHIGPISGSTPALQDMIVHKFGRTTGYTVGRITSVATNVQLRYETGLFTFTNQIFIEGMGAPFSGAGDSGSLIVDRTSGKAVGLLFAGSSTHSAANHIDDVLAAFPTLRLR